MQARPALRKLATFGLMTLALVSAPLMGQQTEPVPTFKVTVVDRTTTAVNYRHRSGSTTIDFEGTDLLPMANGEAKVESKQGYIEIEVEFDELEPATKFGPEYLTYVLWAVTPEGRTANLGEILLEGNRSKLNVTTELQAFSLIVTAEPHFAVTRPSNVVVMENVLRPETRGEAEVVQAKYGVFERGHYANEVNRAELVPLPMNPEVPLELYEAQNAIRIARWSLSNVYAPEAFAKAEMLLRQAEELQARKEDKKEVIMMAREAVQTAEDARLTAMNRREEEQLANERRAAQEREARAKAEAEAETQRRMQAEADRAAAERSRLEAERVRQEAEAAARLAEQRRADAEADRAIALSEQQAARAEAERVRLAAEQAEKERREAENLRQQAEVQSAQAATQQQAALADAERARLDAQQAEARRLEAENRLKQAEDEKRELRAELMRQLNQLWETRDTARGLIVSISDVLFDTGKSELKPGAREKLAKISGIILAHPGLKVEIEGHTDSVGSEQYNQELSEKRAQAVRDYFVQQGIESASLTVRGLGESNPVASNSTPAGRMQNRRVELVVSGEAIGTTVSQFKSPE